MLRLRRQLPHRIGVDARTFLPITSHGTVKREVLRATIDVETVRCHVVAMLVNKRMTSHCSCGEC